MRRILPFVGVLALVATAAPAAAQTCLGSSPISESSVHLLGGTSFSSYSATYGVGVTGGSSATFGSLTVGRVELGDFDKVAAMGLLANVGGQIAADAHRRVVVCPYAQTEYAFANNIHDIGLDGSTGTFAGGVAVGFIAAEGGDVQLVPTVRFLVGRSWVRAEFMGESETMSDTLGIISVGAGLVMHRRFAIVPLVSRSVGTAANSTSFALNVSVGFGGGGPRPATEPNMTAAAATTKAQAPAMRRSAFAADFQYLTKAAHDSYASCLASRANALSSGAASATEIAEAAQSDCQREFMTYRTRASEWRAAGVSPGDAEPAAFAFADVNEAREVLRRGVVARVLRLREAAPTQPR